MRYHPHTPADVRAMLAAIGAESVADLFRSIPAPLRLKRPLAVEPPLDELALLAEARRLASRNAVEHPPFAGAGCYPHHVPPAVDQLLLRGEFFTAYTPYQPEISQGTLQALFEWQTYCCLLTGMEVANASMYDGATATAEAALMATRITGRKRLVISAAAPPRVPARSSATYLRVHARRAVDRPVRRRRPHRSRRAGEGGERRHRRRRSSGTRTSSAWWTRCPRRRPSRRGPARSPWR